MRWNRPVRGLALLTPLLLALALTSCNRVAARRLLGYASDGTR